MLSVSECRDLYRQWIPPIASCPGQVEVVVMTGCAVIPSGTKLEVQAS
jgi:hypothetical protein